MDLNHARLPIPPLRHGMERAAIATRGSGSKVIVQVPSESSQCSNALRHSLFAFRQSNWLVAMRRAETKSIAVAKPRAKGKRATSQSEEATFLACRFGRFAGL